MIFGIVEIVRSSDLNKGSALNHINVVVVEVILSFGGVVRFSSHSMTTHSRSNILKLLGGKRLIQSVECHY